MIYESQLELARQSVHAISFPSSGIEWLKQPAGEVAPATVDDGYRRGYHVGWEIGYAGQ